MSLKITSTDTCPHCGHHFGFEEDEVPMRIIRDARYQWMLKGVEQAIEQQGDDDWVDWMAEKERLDKQEKEL